MTAEDARRSALPNQSGATNVEVTLVHMGMPTSQVVAASNCWAVVRLCLRGRPSVVALPGLVCPRARPPIWWPGGRRDRKTGAGPDVGIARLVSAAGPGAVAGSRLPVPGGREPERHGIAGRMEPDRTTRPRQGKRTVDAC